MIGRKKESEILNRLYNSNEAQFVALYGRRRVGKTYLVNELFRNKFTFKHAGLSPIESGESKLKSPLKAQLRNFYNSMVLSGFSPKRIPKDWMDAFLMLEVALQEKDDGSKQLIFIDELPWLDTPKSGFITAFESFWNNWACSRKNLMLIVCGSATSWMSDKLINNHGGLYDRVTYEVKLEPFTLAECEHFFLERNIRFSRYDVANAYMIFGGIPFYMGYFDPSSSLAQNVDRLFFEKNSPLIDEFERLFNSVFTNGKFIKTLVKVIGKKRIGCTREEIISELNIPSNGMLSSSLKALISSDFVIKYQPYGSKKKEYYKLIDPFCIFYLKFVESFSKLSDDFWLSNVSSQNIVSWRGIAFENVCFNHIRQIKESLGISGVSSEESSWFRKGNDIDGAQVDMLIKRKDNILNMCEIKFYNSEFVVDKNIDKQIRNKIAALEEETPKKYAVRPTLITTYGLKQNEYSSIFSNVITLDDLFLK